LAVECKTLVKYKSILFCCELRFSFRLSKDSAKNWYRRNIDFFHVVILLNN